MMRPCMLALAILAPWFAKSECRAEHPLIKLQIDGQWQTGRPVAWSDSAVQLLSRDGRLLEFAPQKATNFSKVSNSFRPFSQSEMRGQLLKEFGKGFEVSGVGHYLVVHPAGTRDQWAPRFEEIYRSFLQYFSARGWRLTEPEFPLVAVVAKSQAQFVQLAQQQEIDVSPSTLGFYSLLNNRVLLYDVTAGNPKADWSISAETIVHETAHQVAYNTGVHNRFGTTPRWLAEGLGTLFEAKGVWNARANTSIDSRVNRYRLEAFQALLKKGRPSDSISQLVSGDRMFQTNPEAAYATSWALVFFLSETQPRKLQELLQKAAQRKALENYPSTSRLEDFTDVLGTNLTMLDAQLVRYISGLK